MTPITSPIRVLRRADVLQIQQAAKTALTALPPLPAHEFASTLDESPENPNGD
jgi:hypothetical protein